MSAMPQLFSIGANHQMANSAVREAISVSASAAAAWLRKLRDKQCAQEAALLSTCNRTEIYCLTDKPQEVAQLLAGDAPHANLFQLRARDAVRHVFSVASGLESQIIGETEIAAQIKRAADLARHHGASGVVINRLLEKSLAAAKAVRRETDIGRHSLSYCGLIARAAAGVFPSLRETAVLFVGAGDMACAGVPLFADRGARVCVASRDTQKAAQLAGSVGGQGVSIARIPDILGDFDVVIAATASQVPIIGKGAVERALAHRRHRPIVFADLGVPHDLEPEISCLDDVFVYTLDMLGEQAAQSQIARKEAAQWAASIIDRHTDDFCAWLVRREHAHSVRTLRDDADTARQEEMNAAVARLRRGEDPQQVMEDFSHRLTGKILHHPTLLLSRGQLPPTSGKKK